ncbi:hypothetical protein ACHQM5_026776 [Ranunculus cassubicifolius]
METELLEIIPRELRFTFELKKMSSCTVQLINKSNQYVAFKIKTTNPKKYCVRPNTGILHPQSVCDFTVTMQAQRVAPPDMQCKDKFLIQGTVVPEGTEAEAITADIFAKGSQNYIEENKLRVFLEGPPQSPVLLPINGVLKEDYEALASRDPALSGVENLPPLHKVANIEENLKPSKKSEELKPAKDTVDLKQAKDVEFKLAEDTNNIIKPTKSVQAFKPTNDVVELKTSKDVKELSSPKKLEDVTKFSKNDEELRLVKDVEELKGKLKGLEAKLSAAEETISILRQERSTTTAERQTMQQQLVTLRKSDGVRKEQVGFPFLFVCMIALIGLVLGYRLHN